MRSQFVAWTVTKAAHYVFILLNKVIPNMPFERKLKLCIYELFFKELMGPMCLKLRATDRKYRVRLRLILKL